MNRIFRFILLVGVCVGCQQLVARQTDGAKVLKVKVDSLPQKFLYELGGINFGDGKVDIHFQLRNETDGDFRIERMVPSCSCATVRVGEEFPINIQSGGDMDFALSIDLNRVRQELRIDIVIGTGEKPIQVSLTGNIFRAAFMVPFDVRHVFSSGSIREFQINAYLDKSVRLVADDIVVRNEDGEISRQLLVTGIKSMPDIAGNGSCARWSIGFILGNDMAKKCNHFAIFLKTGKEDVKIGTIKTLDMEYGSRPPGERID